MAFTLRVLFNGLCAYVPNTEEERGMRVLLIDGRAPGVASNGKGHVSHIPAIRFNAADLDPDRRQPAFRYDYSSQDAEPRGAWFLNGDDLELRVDGKPLPDGPLKVRHEGTEEDFGLVPNVQQIYPESEGLEVREECLDNQITRLADIGLVGRMRLQGGRVGAFAGGKDRTYISSDEYTFTGVPTGHRQRMAACVYFETEVAGEAVEFHSRQRGHGPIFRPANGERLDILIENEPPMELMGSKPDEEDLEYDFELVYNIAKNRPQELRIPIPAAAAMARAKAASREAGILSRPLCPPIVYQPSREAASHGGYPPLVYRSSPLA